MKTARQAEILRIINQYTIETQEELAKKLKESGFSATQATVSRDIRELMLTKASDGKGSVHYVAMKSKETDSDDKYIRTLKDSVVSLQEADNLVVIQTESGMAMASAAAIDELSIPEVIGSIAGDNTIFLAAGSREKASGIKEKIQELIG